jgi:membrane protein DedA with SNARE-associated domain
LNARAFVDFAISNPGRMRDMEGKIMNFFMSVVSSLGNWGYLILFVATFMESAAFLGLLAPGETIVLLAGLLASRGVLDLSLVIGISTVGAILGDSAGYLFGNRFGEEFLLRYGKHFGIHEEELEDTRSFFCRHGGKTVLLARFITWIRALAPFVAGTVHMPYTRFLFFNIYGAALWAIFHTLLGYLIGNSWETIKKYLGHYGLILTSVIAVLTIAYVIAKKKKAKLHKEAGRLDRFLSAQMPALWNFAKNRFRIGPWYGLRLTVGILLLVLCLATLGELLRSILQQGLFTRLPAMTKDFVEKIFSPSLTGVMVSIEQMAGIYLNVAAASLAVGFALWRRQWWLLLVWFLAVFGFLVALAMDLFLPGQEGFPSLEAFAAVITYGLVIHEIRKFIQGEIKRVITISLAVYLILLTGFARIYLDSGSAPSVLAGLIAGLGWLIFTVLLVGALQEVITRQR